MTVPAAGNEHFQDQNKHKIFAFSADKPSEETRCRCENMIVFQNQVTEKLNILVQSNILCKIFLNLKYFRLAGSF